MDSAAIDLQHQFYDMLMRSQYWSADKMRDYQRSQLTHLLRHAKKNVPFYENRLDAVLKPNGDIDWDRWGEIPIVKRSDLVEHREAMQARELPHGHGPTRVEHSSGSTGQPMTVTINQLATVASTLCGWRAQSWHNLDWSQTVCARRGEDPEVSAWPDGRKMGTWGPTWHEATPRGSWYEINRLCSSAQLLEFVGRKSARYYVTAPKPAHVLALDAKRLGVELSLDAILTHGEGVSEEDRQACREAFGAKLIELYSSKEGYHIAHDCPGGPGFHINAETVLVEIVDDSGHPCQAGESGRVVLTPLYSTAQPLIRYDQGDLATAGVACVCGRALPMLARIDGRVTHMFRHPDGRRVAERLPDICRKLLDATMWQIAQVAPLEFEIRYVSHGPARAVDEEAVRQLFRSTYFDDAQVALVRTEALQLTPAGKLIEYRYEVENRAGTDSGVVILTS